MSAAGAISEGGGASLQMLTLNLRSAFLVVGVRLSSPRRHHVRRADERVHVPGGSCRQCLRDDICALAVVAIVKTHQGRRGTQIAGIHAF